MLLRMMGWSWEVRHLFGFRYRPGALWLARYLMVDGCLGQGLRHHASLIDSPDWQRPPPPGQLSESAKPAKAQQQTDPRCGPGLSLKSGSFFHSNVGNRAPIQPQAAATSAQFPFPHQEPTHQSSMPSFSILGAGELSDSSCNNEDRPERERESSIV